MNKVPAFTMFRLLILVVLGFSLGMLLGACQKKKSENSPLGRFVGEWVDVKAPDRFVKISKNGDALIWEDNEGKYSAQFDKGMLKISAEMGEITAQFVESSGHIIAAGHEYIRKNDHNSGEMGMSPPSAVDSTRGLSPDLTRQKGSAPNGDAPSENSACAIGHKAALAVAKADPAVVLAGKQYLWDPDLIKSIQTSALAEARNFTGAELNDTVCDARMVCALPKLGAVYNWFWTRAVAAVVKPLPQSWQPKAGDAITLSPVAQFTMDTIGTDPSIYPELKIKQMAAHQFGCKATVEVTVKHEFAGFLTFHF